MPVYAFASPVVEISESCRAMLITAVLKLESSLVERTVMLWLVVVA